MLKLRSIPVSSFCMNETDSEHDQSIIAIGVQQYRTGYSLFEALAYQSSAIYVGGSPSIFQTRLTHPS